MNRALLNVSCFCLFLLLSGFQWFGHLSLLYSSGPDAGYSGDAAGGFQTCASCHSGSNLRAINNAISSDIPSSGYIPNMTYTIQASINQGNLTRYGFQISPQNLNGEFSGDLIVSDNVKTQLNPDNSHYINHTFQGNRFPTGTAEWSFKWKAPKQGAGKVIFYGAFVMSNADNTSNGDIVSTSLLQAEESGLSQIGNNSNEVVDVSVYPNPTSENLFCRYSVQNDLSKIIFSISQQDGKVVFTRTYENLQSGVHQLTFPISSLSKGLYQLQITSNRSHILKSFFKN